MRSALLVLALLVAAAAPAPAADFPSRPLRLLVPFPPGGGNDLLARIFAGRLSELLGQQVVVDNRGGGGGVIATEMAAKSPADGYTLALGFIGPMAISPSLSKLPYDPARDFTSLDVLASSYHVLVINPSVPAKTMKEFIALAKSQPGKLNYASSGSGTNLHLAAELFKMVAGVNLVHIPYKGAGPAAAAVLAGGPTSCSAR
jgi:tripartite-type tricarboxylate transporter receptor subunit TctC